MGGSCNLLGCISLGMRDGNVGDVVSVEKLLDFYGWHDLWIIMPIEIKITAGVRQQNTPWRMAFADKGSRIFPASIIYKNVTEIFKGGPTF